MIKQNLIKTFVYYAHHFQSTDRFYLLSKYWEQNMYYCCDLVGLIKTSMAWNIFPPLGPITQAAPCQDSVYYEQLIPPLINSVHHAVRAGKLGLQQAGNYLLARHEDRLAYIQIMEKGNGYMVYSAKGLELQETSCHSLEATRYFIGFHLMQGFSTFFVWRTIKNLILTNHYKSSC